MKSERYEKRVQITRYKKIDFLPEGSDQPFKACQLFYGITVESENEVGIKEVKVNVPIEFYDKLKEKQLPVNSVIVFELDDLSPVGRPNIVDVRLLG